MEIGPVSMTSALPRLNTQLIPISGCCAVRHEIGINCVLSRGNALVIEAVPISIDYNAIIGESRLADYGIVVNGDRSGFDDERVTTTQYAINTNLWLLRRPARVEIADENGA